MRPVRKTAAQRAERHQPDAEIVQDADDFLFRFAPEQRVLALQHGDRLHRMGAADGADAGLGQAEVAYLAHGDEFADRPGDLFDRDLGVDPVLVQQVDVIGAQPPQRPVHRAADVVRLTGQAGLAAVGVERETELGRDDHLVADRGERLAGQFLVDVRAVHLGGVEERDTAVDGGPQQLDHLAAVAGVRAEALAHAHAAEPERGHLQLAGAQKALFHLVSPLAVMLSC